MPTANRTEDATYHNIPGQDFRLYVGFGNEVRISTDARLVTPPVTEYPEQLKKVPDRPCVVMGPNRIAFVEESIWFYGGRSYFRGRVPAEDHTWKVYKDGVDVSANTDVVAITLYEDLYQTYRNGPPPEAFAAILFKEPGIFEVELQVVNPYATSYHTGRRQVIVYESRETAYDGIIEIGQISGSVSQGGWACSLRAVGDVSFFQNIQAIEGYVPVVIMVETLLEQVDVDLTIANGYPTPIWNTITNGPNWHIDDYRDDPRIIFSGYVDRASIQVNVETHDVRFECRTADVILEQMQTHTVGFFESASDGKGVTFNDLTLGDVIRYMLQEKSNFADYVDLRMYYNFGFVYDSEDNDQIPNMEYKDWTFNQGQYWSNIRDGANNEFSFAYAAPSGQIFIHPDRNYYHPQVWDNLNDRNQWNGVAWEGDTFLGNTIAHVPIGPERTPLAIISDRQDLTGLIASLGVGPTSGAPIHVPLSIGVQERISAVPGYYKITGNLSFWNEEWGADYPQRATDASQGQWLLSGTWVLDQGRYWSDQDRDRAWANIWRFAARGYAAQRSRYRLEVRYGLHTYFRPGDLIEVVYVNNQARVRIIPPDEGQPNRNYFEIDSIAYAPDLNQQMWTTVYGLREVTIYTAPTPTIPATPPEVDD